MSTPNVTDVTEEDAADLQFPKDSSLCPTDKHNVEIEVLEQKKIFASRSLCHVCNSILVEPYIRCAICPFVELCSSCFSHASEINEHKSYHDYIIIKNEFPLINKSDWNAKQELKLLNVIQDCGFGNWQDVASYIEGKSANECKKHYLQNYIDNQTLPGLPKIKETKQSLFGCEPIPYMFKLHDIEDPPRFAKYTTNNKLLAGYNAARSDFEVNFDNHAEFLISELKFDEFKPNDKDYKLGQALQVAVIQAYNNRLKERARREDIIRRHGLIMFRKIISCIQRYELTITRPIAERLLKFMQLMNGIQFDSFMEGLHLVGQLKNNIRRLLEFRQNGLKHFQSIAIYQKLSKMKQENDRERKQYLNNPEYNWKYLLPDNTVNCNNLIPGNTQRKIAPPLTVTGLPGYEKLSAEEIELCSVARVIPANYLEFKNLLLTENKKCGYLRLAQARAFLKIDVNKTRKIYDFLIDKGYINKPPQ